VTVAKHGNRAATSQCGSADVLEALGVEIELSPEASQRCLEKVGICFMYARVHHAAMRFAAPVRQEIGIRTIFNLLGPLSNPASATHHLIGIFDGALAETYAEVLRGLGVERALVVHGCDGLDELTVTGPSTMAELRDGEIRSSSCEPGDFGIAPAKPEDLAGGDAERNRDILLAILGDKAERAQMDAAALNAGAALYVAGKAESIAEGVDLARRTVASGAAMETLEALRDCSHKA
jgi:anthranilate phosphoribosyltransferase